MTDKTEGPREGDAAPAPPLPEGNTEPVMLPVDTPAGFRDEAAETGTVAREEIDDMVKVKTKRPVPPAAPPKPPKAPPPVDLKQPPPLWFWVTFGVLVAAITVGLTYVLKARGSRATPSQGGGGESAIPRRDPASPRVA
jgi:hypothetical protein